MLLLGSVRAQNVVVGVNVLNPMRASVADQNVVLGQLEAAHVHVIRCGISNDDKGIDYAKRAAAKGIRILLGIGPNIRRLLRLGPIGLINFLRCGADTRCLTPILSFRGTSIRGCLMLSTQTASC
jgi:hypothetical protein